MPACQHSVFTGWMPFLPPNQQCQSTEGNKKYKYTDCQKQYPLKRTAQLACAAIATQLLQMPLSVNWPSQYLSFGIVLMAYSVTNFVLLLDSAFAVNLKFVPKGHFVSYRKVPLTVRSDCWEDVPWRVASGHIFVKENDI